MNKLRLVLLLSIVLCASIASVFAQGESNIVRKDLSQAEIDRIVRTFTQKEAEFRETLKGYAFNRDVVVQTVGLGGQITGEYRRDSFLTFNEDGGRFEKILFSPISTLKDLTFSAADIEDLGGVNPFALDPSVINLYNLTYVGKEKIDELDLYVFDVAPKVIPNPRKSRQRVFAGRIWVDDRDLLIVKSKGKALPEGKDMDGLEQRFPIVETWRENIEGKFWFPALSVANDELVFSSGDVIRLRMRVKYSNYRQGKTDVRILDDEETVPEETPKPTPTPKKP